MFNRNALLFSLAVCCALGCMNAADPLQCEFREWELPDDQKVPTVYFQGMFASQTQAAKYTGQWGFDATTGEFVFCSDPKKSIPVIYKICIGRELSDVTLGERDASFKALRRKLGIIRALWHTVVSAAVARSHAGFGIKVQRANGIGGTSTVAYHLPILSNVNVGQRIDIATHQEKVQACGDGDKILYGVSRGTIATFIAYVINHADPAYVRVRMVVLEGAIDSHDHVVKARLPRFLRKEPPAWSVRGFYNLAESMTSFKREGETPLAYIDQFPKEMPVLLITSLIDKEVPAECTINLAEQLARAGHKQVYLCRLKHSRHPRYAMDNEEDRKQYTQFMHTLYKKYGLPYIKRYVDADVEAFVPMGRPGLVYWDYIPLTREEKEEKGHRAGRR